MRGAKSQANNVQIETQIDLFIDHRIPEYIRML